MRIELVYLDGKEDVFEVEAVKITTTDPVLIASNTIYEIVIMDDPNKREKDNG